MGRPLITLLRSLLYALLFYPATVLWVLAGILLARSAAVPRSRWCSTGSRLHHWLTEHVLGIRTRVEGEVPPGPHLIAVKHQSMFETIETVRIASCPVIVIKRELADIPLFGWMTRRYGVIPVERSAGAKALRALVEQGSEAVAAGRPVIIYPEGTRVRRRKDAAAPVRLCRPLPRARPAGRPGRGRQRPLVGPRASFNRSGTITFKVGEIIPAGLKRDEVEARVHAAINAFELGCAGARLAFPRRP